ncbi:MAG: hypothetical protein N3A69_07045 [Leptospiraceae bacterium]|nr:hypothetical protein [Leptospiraceae bacterium]
MFPNFPRESKSGSAHKIELQQYLTNLKACLQVMEMLEKQHKQMSSIAQIFRFPLSCFFLGSSSLNFSESQSFSLSNEFKPEVPQVQEESSANKKNVSKVDSDLGFKSLANNENQNLNYKLVSLLEKLGCDLVSTYKGAHQILYSDNPDKVRQVSVSLRELLYTTLHRLSPDEEILRWTNKDTKKDTYVNKNGKPTRRARIEFLFQDLQIEDLKKFKTGFAEVWNCILDALSNNVHSVPTKMSHRELETVFLSVENFLVLLLEVGLRSRLFRDDGKG